MQIPWFHELKIKDSHLCHLVETYSLDYASVLCLDGHHNDNRDIVSWMEDVDEAARVSPLAGRLIATEASLYLYQNMKAAGRYTGPWNREAKNEALQIGVAGDPVTLVENVEILEQLMDSNTVFFKHEGLGSLQSWTAQSMHI
jgi:hypothetical protein